MPRLMPTRGNGLNILYNVFYIRLLNKKIPPGARPNGTLFFQNGKLVFAVMKNRRSDLAAAEAVAQTQRGSAG
jgi:hypothetical protein